MKHESRKQRKKRKLIQANSLRLNLWVWFLAFVLIVFLLLWIFQVLSLQAFYDRTKKQDVKRIASYMNTLYEEREFLKMEQLAADNDLCMQTYDTLFRKTHQHHCIVGCMLHNRESNTASAYAGATERDCLRALKDSGDDAYITHYTNEKINAKMMVYVCPLGEPGLPQGYLILNASLKPAVTTVNIIRKQLVIITIMLIVITVFLSMIVAERLARPIVRVTRDAEQLAHGKYDIKFNGRGYDEAERLAETLTYASHEINRVDSLQRDLIANASHDLRTPLTMLKAYAEMIRDLSGDNPVKRAEHLNVIIEETDRLTALVNDILDLSKYENGKMTLDRTTFDMEAHMHEIIDRYRGLSSVSGYTFELETDGEAVVNCDSGKIEQVVCNLINNAMNYTGADKQIFVSLTHVPEGVKIAVRDTGAGMDQETICRIFDKYYRSENYKREVRGTGLGLSIVKAILRMHDYAFGADSTVGVGSTFWFIIHDEQTEHKDKKQHTLH